MSHSALPPAGPPTSGASPDPAAPDWAALARLATREPATDADGRAREDAARAWLAAHPLEAARLAALGDALTGLTTASATRAPDVDVEAALARVRSAVGLDRAAAPQLTVVRGGAPRSNTRTPVIATPRHVVQPRRVPGWHRAAGLLAASAVFAAGLTWWRTGGLAGRGIVGPTVAAGGTATAQRYTTGVGERQVLHLADGSQVVLGPASTLDVPAGYGGTIRHVRLAGEAYFRAQHDARRPFEVAAGDAIVRDIGTAFVVRAPDGGTREGGAFATGGRRAVEVAVTSGAVQLRAASDSVGQRTAAVSAGVLLHAGDRGRVLAATGSAAPAVSVVARGADVAADTAWTTGHLVFRDAPLGEVAGALHRWYGIQLRFADSTLAQRHLTATFAGESTDAVLRVVGLATGARFERRGDTVVVREAAPSP